MLWIDRVRTNPFLRQLKHSDGSTEDVEISEIDSNITTTGTPLDSNNLNKIVCGDTQYGGTIVTNIDTINKSGYYTCYGTATGAPNTSYSWFIHHQNSNAGTASATQRAVAYSLTLIVYERVKVNGTWGNWGIDLTKNIITAWGTSNQTLSSGNAVISLTNSNAYGSLLTLSNNAIKIGAGITKVKVSANVFYQDSNLGPGYMWPRIMKNNNQVAGSIAPNGVSGTANVNSVQITPKIISVTQGDLITLISSTSSSTIRAGEENTYLTVEAVG